MTTRRGFLAALAGVATATTFMTRFPLLPRGEITFPKPSPDWGKLQLTPKRSITLPVAWEHLEMGLLRADQHELRARDYVRVCPELIQDVPGGQITVKGMFPTVRHAPWTTRGMALFAPHGGPMLFYKPWSGGWGEPQTIKVMPGDTVCAQCSIQIVGEQDASGNLAERLVSALLKARTYDS